ncbi:hypothetical protein EON62_04465 [archaeon]|nr:MAG: hypothetical protein EON62_04465 [archaeon]
MAASSSSSDVPASPIGEAACLKGKLFLPIQPHAVGRHKKITIVGAGAVGLACAYRYVFYAAVQDSARRAERVDGVDVGVNQDVLSWDAIAVLPPLRSPLPHHTPT